MGKAIFTIGHSNHKWDAFAALLAKHGIELLVDTRTNPVSRYAPWANARKLKDILGQSGLDYAFIGDSLGGKPSDGSCYRADGRPDYRKIRTRDFFRDGIDTLMEITEGKTVALMCAEEDPSKCHRRLLIEPALLEKGLDVRHIRGDGTVATSGTLGNKKAYTGSNCRARFRHKANSCHPERMRRVWGGGVWHEGPEAWPHPMLLRQEPSQHDGVSGKMTLVPPSFETAITTPMQS